MSMHVHCFNGKLLNYGGDVNVENSIPPHPHPLPPAERGLREFLFRKGRGDLGVRQWR